MSANENKIIFKYDSDLLKSDAQIIAQQCNCTSKKAKGLSLAISQKFPYADFYSGRTSPSTPGTIKIAGKRKANERYVLAMFGQINPGKPKKSGKDTAENRVKYFKMCLDAIAKRKGVKSIAFPEKIGCGLAGGDWDVYLEILRKWAEDNPKIKVVIVSQGPETSKSCEPEKMSSSKTTMTVDQNTLVKDMFDHFESGLRNCTPEEKVEFLEFLLKRERGIVLSYYSTWLTDKTEELYKRSEGDTSSEEDPPSDGEETVEADAEITWKNTSFKEYVKIDTPASYEEIFEVMENNYKIFTKLDKFFKKEVSEGHQILPPMDEIFRALHLTPLDEIKVIVVAMDPYHSPGAAMGVAFGHHDTRKKIQPSLRNIYKALENDGYKANFESGDLTKWCKQGVLLINTALTVRQGKAGSHATKTKSGPWKDFIENLFISIDERRENLVVFAWGEYAKTTVREYFTPKKHKIIEAPHPAASAYNPKNTEFFDHKPFSRANRYLKDHGKKEIDWNLV